MMPDSGCRGCRGESSIADNEDILDTIAVTWSLPNAGYLKEACCRSQPVNFRPEFTATEVEQHRLWLPSIRELVRHLTLSYAARSVGRRRLVIFLHVNPVPATSSRVWVKHI